MTETQKRLVELSEGTWIEEDLYDIVRRVQQYDPNLKVQYLDPERTGNLTDAPYRILESCPDGIWRIVFGVWELDERVLERLFKSDTQRGNILQGIDSSNLLAQKEQDRRYQDEQDALNELVADTLRSPKDTYTAKNPVTGEKHEFTATKK